MESTKIKCINVQGIINLNHCCWVITSLGFTDCYIKMTDNENFLPCLATLLFAYFIYEFNFNANVDYWTEHCVNLSNTMKLWKNPDSKVHGAHLGPVSPRWAPCWPHEPCYQGNTCSDIPVHHLVTKVFKNGQKKANQTPVPHGQQSICFHLSSVVHCSHDLYFYSPYQFFNTYMYWGMVICHILHASYYRQVIIIIITAVGLCYNVDKSVHTQ